MAFCSALPSLAISTSHSARRLPIPLVSSSSQPLRSLHTTQRLKARLVVRAEESSSSGPDVDAIVKDLTDKWDKVENKSSVAVYGFGAIALLYVTSSIVSAVNSIPLLPKFLELVGFIYTAWFVYRYLLFKSSREELSKDVEELKAKITGQEEM